TEARVLRMLEGTDRAPDEIVADVPPDLTPATVEKVAINAVLAGCRPEYLPVVLAAVEAACTDAFNMHGLLATTWFAGPMVVVSGPIARDISMNDGMGAMGQGNRANATIGRALNLVVRNVGGGRPGGVDRATLGNPGKYTFCFAETPPPDDDWPNQATEIGAEPGASAVTVVAAEGVRGIIDQLSRTPESLARSFAEVLATVAHPKLAIAFDASLVISPEHLRVFRDAGWTKARLREELATLLTLDGADLVRGARDIAEGMPEAFCGGTLPKFRDGGLTIFQAGGGAGMFSAVVGGWAAGDMGSAPVTLPVRTTGKDST
ncbi:MAG: thioredoxin, partial [Microthrixaceae bacterium]|nr:thioredoxin [Microthrixaceae bacterium]